MTFQRAVSNTPVLHGHLHPGLQALDSSHAALVECRPPRRLRGSVCLDRVLDTARPGQPSWDYAIGWEHRSRRECVCFAEVHSASSDHVAKIVEKKRSILSWLRQDAPLLRQLAADSERIVCGAVFHWLATDAGVAIRPGSRQAKLLQEQGIVGPKRRLILE